MKKKIWIAVGVISLIIIMVGISVYRNVFAKGPAVETAEAKMEEISSLLMIPGTLELQNKQSVYSSPELGEIEEILVKEGQQVKKGELLAKRDNPQLQLEVEQNKLAIEQGYLRINQLDKQKKQLDVKKSDLSEQIGKEEAKKQLDPEYDQLELEKKMANLDLKQSLLQKDMLEERVKELEITSLIDGTVLTVREEASGNSALSQEPIILVGTLNKMTASGFLSEYDALKVEKGQKVVLQSDALPDEEWQGEVATIGILPDNTANMNQMENQAVQYPVEVLIASKNIPLKPGYQLIMEIETEKKKSLVIPVNAVKYENDETNIFLLEGSIVRKTEVNLGITSGDNIEVIDGLKVGDKVIVNPSDKIVDGMEVTIK